MRAVSRIIVVLVAVLHLYFLVLEGDPGDYSAIAMRCSEGNPWSRVSSGDRISAIVLSPMAR